MRESVCQCGRDRAPGCVGPVSVEQRLMHTHRRWAHGRELMRATRLCLRVRARERR